jgi:hypothetical protein
VTFLEEAVISVLWRRGFDTKEIADRMGLREFQIANRLPFILMVIRED